MCYQKNNLILRLLPKLTCEYFCHVLSNANSTETFNIFESGHKYIKKFVIDK